jgi:hypothetical protein
MRSCIGDEVRTPDDPVDDLLGDDECDGLGQEEQADDD